MVGDAGELTQGGVDVLGADSKPVPRIAGQGPRVDGYVELALVGGADDAVAPDAAAEEHDRADRPVVLAVAAVVRRGAAHLTLHDDDQAVANSQLFGAAHQVADAGEELG